MVRPQAVDDQQQDVLAAVPSPLASLQHPVREQGGTGGPGGAGLQQPPAAEARIHGGRRLAEAPSPLRRARRQPCFASADRSADVKHDDRLAALAARPALRLPRRSAPASRPGAAGAARLRPAGSVPRGRAANIRRTGPSASRSIPLASAVPLGIDPRGVDPAAPEPAARAEVLRGPHGARLRGLGEVEAGAARTARRTLIWRLAREPRFRWFGRFTRPHMVKKMRGFLDRVQCDQPGSVPQMVVMRHQGVGVRPRLPRPGGARRGRAHARLVRRLRPRRGQRARGDRLRARLAGHARLPGRRPPRRSPADVLRYGVNGCPASRTPRSTSRPGRRTGSPPSARPSSCASSASTRCAGSC